MARRHGLRRKGVSKVTKPVITHHVGGGVEVRIVGFGCGFTRNEHGFAMGKQFWLKKH